ncbi:hypothetical protein AAFF_G00358650 [Aldrovandia affinis]|uniref:Uncharacterized protein n=1 Tax=Aldrovandia affinis TaxID=143900 RepID=A0AAD7X125_9TELE|nr:hypothetical protein AAFF_G00358650 [Aldrovandia affinis]
MRPSAYFEGDLGPFGVKRSCCNTARMKITIVILCFVSTVCAAPMKSLSEYLPHMGHPHQSGRPAQLNKALSPRAQSRRQPGLNAPVSMEIVFPNRGQPNGGTFPSNAFIKYSLPKVPGQNSVEVFYPYDIGQQQQLFPHGYIPQTLNHLRYITSLKLF